MNYKEFVRALEVLYSFLGLRMLNDEELTEAFKIYENPSLNESQYKSLLLDLSDRAENINKISYKIGISYENLQLFYASELKGYLNIDQLFKNFEECLGKIIYSGKEENRNIVDFMNDPENKIFRLDITNYTKLKKIWATIPNNLSPNSPSNAGRFVKENSKIHLLIIGPNTKYRLSNFKNYKILLNISYNDAKIWSFEPDVIDYDLHELLRDGNETKKTEILRNHLIILNHLKNYSLKSSDLVIFIEWEIMPLIPQNIDYIPHYNLLKSYQSEETDPLIKPNIQKRLKILTDIEDKFMYEFIKKSCKAEKRCVSDSLDLEYLNLSGYGYEVTEEIKMIVPSLCCCLNSIGKWMLVKRAGDNFEYFCIFCLKNCEINSGDIICRRYKNYDFSSSYTSVTTNLLYKNAVTPGKKKKSRRSFMSYTGNPNKKKCFEVVKKNDQYYN